MTQVLTTNLDLIVFERQRQMAVLHERRRFQATDESLFPVSRVERKNLRQGSLIEAMRKMHNLGRFSI